MRIVSAILLVLFLPFVKVAAQTSLLIKAGEAYEEGAYARTVRYTEQFLKKNPDNAIASSWDAIGNLAEACRQLKLYADAERYFAIVLKKKSEDPETVLHYAQSLLSNGKMDEAAPWFRLYAELNPEDPRGKSFAEFCEHTPPVLLDASAFTAQALPFCGIQPEFGMQPFRDGFLFCTYNSFNPFGLEYFDVATEKPLYDIFFIRRDEAGVWGEAEELPADINTRFHEGPLSVAPDSFTVYFSRSGLVPDHIQGKNQMTPISTFHTEFRDEKWSEPHEVLAHPAVYMIGDPNVSPDGKWLYFSSDKPGGFGGADIYRARLVKGYMQEPENLGPEINTAGDERYPFLHSSGVLFFASDGHAGFGGLDLFRSESSKENWLKPANMGKPFNSSGDDFGLWADASGEKGFFASSRTNGEMDYDIFEFQKRPPEFCDCDDQKKTDYCYRFAEERSAEEFPDEIGIVWDFGDGTTESGHTVRHCFEKPGVYLVRENIIEKKTNKPVFMESSFDLTIEEGTGVWIMMPDTYITGKPVRFSGEKTNLPGLRNKTWLWDLGDGTLMQDSVTTHIFSTPGVYTIRLMVTGESAETSLIEKQCTRKKILILPPSEAKNKNFDANGSGPGDGPGLVEKRLDVNFSRANHPEMDYQVQIGTSLEYIETLPVNFRGLENVSARQDGDIYRYFFGKAENISEGRLLLNEVRDKGFEDAILLGFKKDTLLKGQGSETAWLPADNSKFIVLSGIILDTQGKPLGGSLVVEDFFSGDTAGSATVNSSTGEFRIKVVRGRKYGYYFSHPDYYPVSGYADLSGQGLKIVYRDTLIAVQDSEFLAENHTLTLHNIFFERDQSKVIPDSWQELFRLTTYLQVNKKACIEIICHTENTGDPYEALMLSRHRAAEIEKFLIMLGTEPERVTSVGKGATESTKSSGKKIASGQENRIEIRTISPVEAARLKPGFGGN